MVNLLKTSVGEVKLRNPLLLASGHITETPDFFLKTTECAGMVTRSLKEHVPPERRVTPAPRYFVFNDGQSMLNCEWGNSRPWTEWRDSGVDKVKDAGGTIIISLSGREIDSCAFLIQEFDRIGVDAFEINVSCAHSGALHGNLNIDFSHMEKLLKKIRPITKTPIWVKLSYSSVLVEIAKKAEELGADAIVCTNSIGPGMFIDTKTGVPMLGVMNGAGGVTGKAIFPIALNCVYQLAQNLNIPIVGSGGIFTADDVIQMLMAGASAVQLYTAPALIGYNVFSKIAMNLNTFMRTNNYRSISELIGLAQGTRETHDFRVMVPEINQFACIGCGACSRVCNFGAITFGHPVTINEEYCSGCSACVEICPTEAISIERRPS